MAQNARTGILCQVASTIMKDFIKKFIQAGEQICDGLGKLEGLITYETLYKKMYRVPDSFDIYDKNLKILQKRGMIRKGKKGFRFSDRGRDWFIKSRIKYFELRNKKWDKKWRVIIFDIPEELHNERNNLRRKLKSLGFYILQKSVFVFPYPCEEELGDLCAKIGVGDYVDIIVAESIGFKEEEIKQIFAL